MFLSLVLLIVMAIIGVAGLFSPNTDSFKTSLSAFSVAFSFVAGVAIGRGSTAKQRKHLEEDEETDLPEED